jgi:hypothetical protein
VPSSGCLVRKHFELAGADRSLLLCAAYRRSMSATRQEIDAFHRELQRKSLDGQSAEQDAQEVFQRSQVGLGILRHLCWLRLVI